MSENCVRRKKEITNPEIFIKPNDQFSKYLSKYIPKRVQFPKRARWCRAGDDADAARRNTERLKLITLINNNNRR